MSNEADQEAIRAAESQERQSFAMVGSTRLVQMATLSNASHAIHKVSKDLDPTLENLDWLTDQILKLSEAWQNLKQR